MLGKLQERQNVILGDEMGLGKTIQVHALVDHKQHAGFLWGKTMRGNAEMPAKSFIRTGHLQRTCSRLLSTATSHRQLPRPTSC